ncbi:MAG: AbrB/MazE/SpoVT family DNA-binding domain-containing protein [Planctomycetes bacterium]|jgi:antitoxin MazE|nr:AbrB/MazE/SpoVT family DNA-binding domain-containing protein [Planctomycetota bacterium]
MSNAVKARIIKMGNSRGVRIPKPILEQLALGEEVELSVRGDQLVIRPGRQPRRGWEDQFQRMAERGDDRLLDEETVSTTKWDEDEWEWK